MENLRLKIFSRYDAKAKTLIDYRDLANRYTNAAPDIDDGLMQTIIKVLITMQNDMVYYRNHDNSKYLEYIRNRFVSSNLMMAGYTSIDHQTGGISLAGKGPGERDIVVYDTNDMACLIYEGFNLTSFNHRYIDLHINKLLVNYDPLGLRQGVLVVYLECSREKFKSFTEKYKGYISEHDPGQYKCIDEPSVIPTNSQFLVYMKTRYKLGGFNFVMNHIIVRIAP